MKKAVIDIGSNTINLVIGDVQGEKVDILFEDKNHAKLAKGGIHKKKMTDAAIQRGMKAIKIYLEKCKSYEIPPHEIRAFATATIRSTSNGAFFVQSVYEQFGIKIDTITGDQEAEMIHEGVAHGFPMDEKNVLILDIGGGSNEFILSNINGIIWKHSFNLGVSRMLERFHPTEPISSKEVNAIKTFFKAELALLFEHVKPQDVHALVGSSGSFDTIRNMILLGKNEKNDESLTWLHLKWEDLCALVEKLIPSTREERTNMAGMILLRVDYMVVAALFIQVVLEELKIKNVYQCNYALKEGALFIQ